MFQLERLLMPPVSLNPVAQLSCEALRLGCEAYSLIGLRLFKMTTGGVPAVSEALRMAPEKITALIDAQVLGGFKRSSQHSLCWLLEATGQAPLQVFSNQASFGAWH